jgi:hypothetical protein
MSPVFLPVCNNKNQFHSWFENSFDKAKCMENSSECKLRYYETYGYKIFYDKNTTKFPCVEFPNETEAIMFVLRWS